MNEPGLPSVNAVVVIATCNKRKKVGELVEAILAECRQIHSEDAVFTYAADGVAFQLPRLIN
jgi:hypothetical protein